MESRVKWGAAAGAVSVLVGAIYVFPHALFLRKLGGDYWGFALLGSPDKEFYLSLVRDVIDGHGWAASPFLFEHKDAGMCAFPLLGVWIAALPGQIFGFKMGTLTIFWDFFAPACATALLYACYRRAGLSQMYSIAGAAVAMASPYLLAGEPALLPILTGARRSHGFYFFLPMMRTVNPQQGALVFIAALTALLWATSERGKPAAAVIASAAMFLTSLSNIYYAGFMIALCFAFAAWSAFSGAKRAAVVSVVAGLSGAAGMAVVAGNLMVLKDRLGPLHAEDLVRGRMPLIGPGGAVLLVLSVAAYLISRRIGDMESARRASFAVAAALSYNICMNQQALTGAALQPWHYEVYVAPFLLPLAFFIFIDAALQSPSRVRYGAVIAAALAVASLADGALEQGWGYRQTHQTYAAASRIYRAPFEWLQANAAKDDVVMADPLNTARFVTVYTSLNVLASTGASEFPVPSPAEMNGRLMWNMAGMGVTPRDFAALTFPDDSVFHFAFFSRQRIDPSTGRGYTERLLPPISEERIASLAGSYGDIYANYDLEDMPYRLDYVLAGPYEARGYVNTWKIEPFCSSAVQLAGWVVCRVARP